MSDRFEELLGDVADPHERERLRRVHELLLAADPPPELAPADQPAAPLVPLPSRRRALTALLAAALALALFGAGWLAGDRRGGAAPEAEIAMAAPSGDARATIDLLPQDDSGNWPLVVRVRGLEPSADRQDYYELWLTRDGKLAESCGRFTVHPGETEVTLSVPYALRTYDGWVVTRRGSDRVLLTT